MSERRYGKQQRYRFKDSSTFHVVNIKRGAEKRADDDMKELMLKTVHLDPEKGIGKDIIKAEQTIGKSTNSLTRNIINTNIREIKESTTKAMANGENPKTLNNFMGMTKLSYTLLSNTAISYQNRENIKIAKKMEDAILSKDNIKELSNVLENEKVIIPKQNIHVGASVKSIQKLEKKIDTAVRTKLGFEPSKVSKNKLIKHLDNAIKTNDKDLQLLLETEIAIKELKGKTSDIKKGKLPKVRRKKNISGQIRKLLNMNMDSYELKGLNQILMYQSLTKTLAKGSYLYGKAVGKFGFAIGKGIGVVGGRVVLGGMDFFGYKQQANFLRNKRNEITTKMSHLKTNISRMKLEGKTLIDKAPVYAVRGGIATSRFAGRTTIKGAKFVGTKVAKTQAFQTASNSTAGKVAKGVTKKTSNITKKGFQKTKVLGKKTKKVLAPPAKIFKQFGDGVVRVVTAPFRFVLKGINLINMAATKLLFIIGGLLAGYVIIAVSAVAIINGLTVIGDAVSDSLEEFKTKTTMGATYDKLLEKEREFNAAVADLINEPIPTGDPYSYIKEWTNYNVHYIGPDGKEMFGSSAYGYGNTIEGVGGFDIVVNSTSDQIWTFLKKMGWNDYGIAGIMGNIMNECSMNHTAGHNQPDRHDIGIVQWTGPRYFKFIEYANQYGGPYDLDTQLRYLINEDNYEDIVANMGYTDWTNVNSPTDYFIDEYEKYANYESDMKERSERRNAAQSYYNHYTKNDKYANIERDEDFIADVGASQGTGDGTDVVVTSNLSSYSTSTIKGILSMAAIYIDQDFKKYGAYTDGIFADSVYKDYCAKLYDSTHIIGKDATPPEIYYCPAYTLEVASDEPHAATEACNNKIEGGSSDENWLNSGTGMNRKYSLSLSMEEDSYEVETEDDGTETRYYDKYTVLETGPHGSVSYVYDSHDEDKAKVARAARQEMKDRGCKNMIWKTIDKGEGYSEFTYACACDLCKGHIDGNAYVFISNIYDPTNDVMSNSQTNDNTEENDNTNNSKEDAYDNVEKKDAETRFSMYALDKYATAFDAPSGNNGILGTGYCTDPICTLNQNGMSGYANAILNSEDIPVCELCGTEILEYHENNFNNPGDQESVDAADATENRAAEQLIMEELTGKPIEIKDWWNNENWFTNTFSTNKTYFRLYTGEESFDTLEPPEKDENGFRNVVNKDNSTPYWFNAFSSKSGRNYDFERHGWDEDSITRVRLLMAGDWLELYGIQDFGGVTGAPLTDEQLSQLIANSPEFNDLPKDRKAIIGAAYSFQENVAKRYNTRYVYGGGHGSLKRIEQIGPGDTFDCSSYVCTILYNAGMYSGPCLSTNGFPSSPFFQAISYADLKPGDILVKPGKHVVLYMGGNKISHASTSSKPLKDTFNEEKLQYYMKNGFTPMRPTRVNENVFDD